MMFLNFHERVCEDCEVIVRNAAKILYEANGAYLRFLHLPTVATYQHPCFVCELKKRFVISERIAR